MAKNTDLPVVRQPSHFSCQWPGCQQPGETALVLSQYQVLCHTHARAEQESTVNNYIQVDFLRTMARAKSAWTEKGR